MRKILVTGGSGFIGSCLVKQLVEKKFNVIVIDKKKPKNNSVKFIESNLLNLNILKNVTKNVDCIFHLAGVSDINKVKKIPVETIRDNVLITTYLLEASRINKIKRFIFASSIYSHGKSGNLYTTSKISSENIIKNFSLLYNLKYTVLRYATAYGTNNRGADVISLFLTKAVQNRTINVHGDGTQTRDFIHAEDIAQCSIKALNRVYENKIITVGNKKRVSICNIAKLIKKITKSKSAIKVDKKRKRFDDFDLNDMKKIPEKYYLKFKNKYTLKSGIEKLYKEHKK